MKLPTFSLLKHQDENLRENVEQCKFHFHENLPKSSKMIQNCRFRFDEIIQRKSLKDKSVPEMSQTRTVWSKEAETKRSSLG